MLKKHLYTTVILSLLISTLAACNGTPQAPAPTMDMGAIQTAVVAAIKEQNTQEALAQPSAVPTEVAATQTPWVVTATFSPATETAIAIPSLTPVATKKPATANNYVAPTPTWGPAHMTKQSPIDNTKFSPGESFDASWTFINSSTKNWNKSYYIRWVSGDLEPAQKQVMIGDNIDIGRTYTFTVDYVAPGQAGRHESYWEFVDDNGAVINRFWLIINVQ